MLFVTLFLLVINCQFTVCQGSLTSQPYLEKKTGHYCKFLLAYFAEMHDRNAQQEKPMSVCENWAFTERLMLHSLSLGFKY